MIDEQQLRNDNDIETQTEDNHQLTIRRLGGIIGTGAICVVAIILTFTAAGAAIDGQMLGVAFAGTLATLLFVSAAISRNWYGASDRIIDAAAAIPGLRRGGWFAAIVVILVTLTVVPIIFSAAGFTPTPSTTNIVGSSTGSDAENAMSNSSQGDQLRQSAGEWGDTIRYVEVRQHTVSVTYRAAPTTKQQAKQLGWIAGGYTSKVDEGWEFRSFEATVVNQQGQTIGSWSISNRTVRQYTFGEVDNSELTDRILAGTTLPFGDLTPSTSTSKPTTSIVTDMADPDVYRENDEDDHIYIRSGGGGSSGSCGDNDGDLSYDEDNDADNDGICDEG